MPLYSQEPISFMKVTVNDSRLKPHLVPGHSENVVFQSSSSPMVTSQNDMEYFTRWTHDAFSLSTPHSSLYFVYIIITLGLRSLTDVYKGLL